MLTDLNPGDVTLSRDGNSDDLVLTVTATGKTITLKGEFNDNSARGSIETVVFADGSTRGVADLK